MEYGGLLLLFDGDNPSWTEELVGMAGEDPGLLGAMVADGLLRDEGGVFSLTDAGREAFREEAAACFLPASPGTPEAGGGDLFRTRLRLLIDRKHVQRWGLKEFAPRARFLVPPLRECEIYRLAPGLEWVWPSAPVFARMREDWPITGLAARNAPPPEPGAAEGWFETLGVAPSYFEVDLLHLSRYDFQSYAGIPRSPNDPWGLLNADRFFCVRGAASGSYDVRELLATTGRFQLALEVLRRMVLPGYMDLDSFDQGCVNWLVFVCDREEEAAECESLLSPFGVDLVRGSAPMEVWVLSLEGLEGFQVRAETIHDLLPAVGRPAARTP